MPVEPTTRSRPLILAVGSTMRDLADRVRKLLRDDERFSDLLPHVIETPAAALRLTITRTPSVLYACVGIERLALVGDVLDALHQRRPHLPVVAVTRQQDAALERVFRTAGASVYLPLSGAIGESLLRDTVESLTNISPRDHPPNHTGLSPPSTRAGPPIHVSLHTRSLEQQHRPKPTSNPQGEPS